MAAAQIHDQNQGIQDVFHWTVPAVGNPHGTNPGDIWHYELQGSNPTDESLETPITNQAGQTVGSVPYDKHTTVNITATGPALPIPEKDSNEFGGCRFPLNVGTYIRYRRKVYKINSIAETGTAVGVTTWALTLERWNNFPLLGDTPPALPAIDGAPNIIPGSGDAVGAPAKS